jgi:hypothetical protein
MMTTRRFRTRLILILMLAIGSIASCKPAGDPSDATAPEFLQITVTLQRVTDEFEEPPIDATSGLTLDNVQRDRRIIIEGTAADDQSGVERVQLTGGSEWTCLTPGEDQAQIMQGDLAASPQEGQPTSTDSVLPALWNSTFSVDPFQGNSQRLVCPATDEASELTVNVRVRATNGNGIEGQSPEIEISYQARPPG